MRDLLIIFSSVFSAQCSSLTNFHNANDLVGQFNVVCSSVSDHIAPIMARRQSNLSPWVSDDSR